MTLNRRVVIVSVAVAVGFILLAFQPAVSKAIEESASALQTPNQIPSAFRDLSRFVRELMNNTDDTNNSDSDGMPDSVELVIGTDPANPDSDFDNLNDYEEALMGMDPNKADSNDDRFSDYLEVTNVSPDLDGDGLPNAWDSDNDNDGVADYLDSSPFAETGIQSSFQVDVSSSGKPTYVSFQLRTKNPDHMRLIQQSWDWPLDTAGSLRDLDGSTSDIVIIPTLKIDSTNLPPQEEVIDYGIVIDGSSAYVPLFPIWDYGNMVALKGRMFLPESPLPITSSYDVSLVWRVSGVTDFEAKAFVSEDGHYISVEPDGSVLATGHAAGLNETFSWSPLGGDKAALRAANSMYLALQANGTLAALSDELTSASEFTFKTSEGGQTIILASNGKNLVASPDGTLSATGFEVGGRANFTKLDLGVVSSPMSLATYYEDFMLTGMTVDENHGSTIGVFNGTNPDELIAANLLLAYKFLRDPANDLNDVPALLTDHDLDGVSYDIRSFSHQDQATQASMSSMIPAAVDSIPMGLKLPVIVGIEDSYASLDMSDLSSDYKLDGPLSFDLTNEPVVVSKALRSSWYEGGSDAPLELYQVIDEARTWNMNSSSLETAVGLLSAWYCGEIVIASVGGVVVDHGAPEVVFVDETLESILTDGMDAIGFLMNAIEVLDCAYAFSETFAKMATLVKSAGQSTWNLFKTTFTSIKQGLTSGTKIFERLGTVLNVVAVVIAIGISLYALFAIGNELGWDAVGTGIAVTYAVVTLAYSIALIALSVSFPPYGAIAAAVIGIIDMFAQLLFGFDLIGEFIGWLIDCFTDVRTRSNVDMDYIDSDMNFDDVDKNGMTAGDNITYSSRLYGNVSITGDGSWDDVVDSYITPHQVLSAPWGSRSTGGGSTVANSTSYTATSKSTLYTTEAWLRPGIGMVNFPVAVGLYTDYKIYYDDCWWFFGWWCDRESQANDPANTQVTQWTTIYFDIMPASIDDFYNWRAIPSSDSDGDGLNNSEEAAASTDPWLPDTDGDGLGDDYEVEIGLDPRNADVDRDGLNDLYEHSRGYDPLKSDSDGDGLSDFFENRGWAVNMTYRGQEYYWMVNSCPQIVDTDGDGINDFDEYHSLLNPRSGDTDGDGTPDEALNYYITRISFDSFFTIYTGIEADFYNPHFVAVDDDGFVYTDVDYYHSDIVTYAPNGTPVGRFTTAQEIGHGVDLDCVSVNVSGVRTTLLFVSSYESILIYSTNGMLLGQLAIGDFGGPPYNSFIGLALDPNGPDPGMYYMYITTFDCQVHKLLMNGTSIVSEVKKWGSYGSGPGQFNFGSEGPRAPLAVDREGQHVYVWDRGNSRVQKFDSDGRFMTMWGEYGTQDGYLSWVQSVEVDSYGNVLTFDWPAGDFADRIQKWSPEGRWMSTFQGEVYGNGMCLDREDSIYIAGWLTTSKWNHTYEQVNPVPDYTFVDADSDGLTDIQEAAGWNITVRTKQKTATSLVTSDPMAPDTDFDGISDPDEAALLSNPRSIDSDDDKLSDLEEIRLGTNLTSWDSDGDGLGDAAEIKFGSDPNDPDSDNEGLSDYEEFVIGSDPNKNDTDEDALDDLQETVYGSDPKNPDSDGDFMFDGQEESLGADSDSKDSDMDGIEDGYEVLYDTNATSGDSDGDRISDGFEVSALMSPLSNDTDSDGVNDSRELELGLNPKSRDSDGDGVPDSLDQDYLIQLDDEIVLVYDDQDASAEFAAKLAENATVRIVNVTTLLSDYADARYIVLVGDPGAASGTAGGLISELLQDSPDVLERMNSSEYERMAVRYGLWTDTQTIVMLSQVVDTDATRVIGVLKSMRMTVSGHSVLVDYLNPRACFRLDQIDTMRVTDTFVWGWVGNMTTFSVMVEKLNDTEVPRSLSDSSVLSPEEVIMDKYVLIEFNPNDTNISAVVQGALVQIYYTASDLDLNGDGDIDDLGDLNETYLGLFIMSAAGDWTRLSDVTSTTGVNTTDVELFGNSYEGYVWANVSHLSLFGIAGLTNEGPPTPDELYDELRDLIVQFRSPDKLTSGRANSLLQKVDASESQWQRNPDGSATINALEALIKEVSAIVRTGVLTGDEGALLVSKANQIINAIQTS